MIALILATEEIRKLLTRYNHTHQQRTEELSIYKYEDRNGFFRFSVNVVTRGSHPLIRFSTKGDAWNFLWQKVREMDLCPKLSGLQTAKGLCFEYQADACKGSCMGIETPKKY